MFAKTIRRVRLAWYESKAWRAVDQVATRLLRHRLNGFAKSVISQAQERGHISNQTWHEIAAIIDRRLWPERYR